MLNRGQERSCRNPVDLCILVLRSLDNIQHMGALKCHSKRLVKSFVGCSGLLEPGKYTVVCLAFNHYNPGTFVYLLLVCFTHLLITDIS